MLLVHQLDLNTRFGSSTFARCIVVMTELPTRCCSAHVFDEAYIYGRLNSFLIDAAAFLFLVLCFSVISCGMVVTYSND